MAQRLATKLPLPLSLDGTWRQKAPSYGSVHCSACGRMMPAINEYGAYTCTCGNADYANGAAARTTSAKR
jgi:hypothetical protein